MLNNMLKYDKAMMLTVKDQRQKCFCVFLFKEFSCN